MKEGHEIIDQVYAAKSDPDAADGLIRQYMGFIRAETAKFLNRPPAEGRDEEFSVAMLAFYESILGYEKGKGAFLSYSARGIRNRLIDHYRKERRHAHLSSLHEAVEDDAETLKIDMLEDSRNEIQALHDRSAVREEIDEFERKLLEFGISFPEVADNCPRQGRTLAACQRVLAAARRAPALLDKLLGTGKLPVTAIARASGVERKTIERHRKYLVAVLLAFTNGYEIIRGHLYHLSSSDGPGAADGPASEGSRENGA